MAKQTFTTGQVLTAAQMTTLQANDYNQTVSAKTASYVLVAADAGTRITMNNAGATTITVNTGLFTAGDTLIITNIGAGACTITAGTATVSTAGSLILNQYDSGTLYFSSASAAIWNGANPGDITGVTAGTGISGGGTSGTVTITNSMATEITASGDIIVGTGSGTFDNLPIGTTGQILTADTTVSPYKVKWAAASSGALTLITRSSFSNVASVTYDSVFSSTYGNYLIVIENWYAVTSTDDIYVKMRYGSTTQTTTYNGATTITVNTGNTAPTCLNSPSDAFLIADQSGTASEPSRGFINIPNVGVDGAAVINGQMANTNASRGYSFYGAAYQARTYTGFILQSSSSNVYGTVAIYGYKVA
jgi:hypothetical protein